MPGVHYDSVAVIELSRSRAQRHRRRPTPQPGEVRNRRVTLGGLDCRGTAVKGDCL